MVYFAGMYRYFILLLAIIALTSSCISHKPYYNAEAKSWQNAVPDLSTKPVYSVYLIGDAGLPKQGEFDTVKNFLRNQLISANGQAGIIFMGDNIYPAGMPPQSHKNRAKAENSIASQLDILKGFTGEIIFIPGNHDWNQSRKQGKEYIIREAEYLENSTQNKITFLPDSACPGPVEVTLAPNLVLLLIDSEWWLHKHEKPYGENSYCSAKTEDEFETQLKQLLEKNKQKQVIIAAHHPVFSNGTHGGYFPLKDHIFPLAAFKKNLYLPLPVLGSIYVAYRKYLGHRQDIPNKKYRAYNQVIKNALAPYKNVIYAGGHEHNLQYFNFGSNHFVVSGSGSKSYYVKRGGDAAYAHNARGFSVLNLYEDGSFWLEYWAANKANGAVELYFRKRI